MTQRPGCSCLATSVRTLTTGSHATVLASRCKRLAVELVDLLAEHVALARAQRLAPLVAAGERRQLDVRQAVLAKPTAGASEVTVPGKDFADALLLAWLGADALDDDLKKALLGRK